MNTTSSWTRGVQFASASRSKITIKTKGTIVYSTNGGSKSKNLKKGTYSFSVARNAKFYTGMGQTKVSYAKFKKYFDKHATKNRGFELNVIVKNGKATSVACA